MPVGEAAIPTMEAFSLVPPIDPKNEASPKLKTPPSDATSQYPVLEGVTAMPTTGAFNRVPPMEPLNGAAPSAKTPPSEAAIQ